MSPEDTKPGEEPKRPRRRRRRRRKPKEGEGSGQASNRPGEGEKRADGEAKPTGERRRRRRGPRRDRPGDKKEGGKERSGDGRNRKGRRAGRRSKSDVAAALEDRRPVIDETKAKDEPFSPAEVAQMKEHFEFLARYRSTLRLKLNANEDLLVNGARPPQHRGVCLHLLKKVDRGIISRAVARLTDPEAKVRLLEGAVRFSNDIAIVLLYLELLAATQTRSAASDALAVGLTQLDFAAASASQMRRVLDLIVTLFDGRQRPQLLFGLLQSETFRGAFDESMGDLPPELAEILAPLRAAYAVILKGEPNPLDAEALASGVRLLLGASTKVLATHPEKVRRRLFEHGAELPETHASLRALLDSFPKDSRDYSNLGMQWARQLLTCGQDDEARAILEEIAANHPTFRQPGAWLEALRGTRVGRVVVTDTVKEEEAQPDRLRSGFWLDRQSTVWLRIGTSEQAERFVLEAQLHQQLLLPNAAPLLTSGVSEEGVPYLAVASVGTPANKILRRRPKHAGDLRPLLRDGALLLHAVAQAGVILPDAEFRRFLLSRDNRLWLGNLANARGAGETEALAAHLELARDWCRALLDRIGDEPALGELLDGDFDWARLAQTLAETVY